MYPAGVVAVASMVGDEHGFLRGEPLYLMDGDASGWDGREKEKFEGACARSWRTYFASGAYNYMLFRRYASDAAE
jgi:hypothetical protein